MFSRSTSALLPITFWRLAVVADFGTQNFNLKTKIDMENKTLTNHENGNDANRLLAVRALSNTQKAVYACLKNWEAEIQVDWEKEQYHYTLVHKSGDIETVRKDTFEKLKRLNLISLKWKPSIDVERWSW
jgi:hypothetical protein